MIQVISIVIIFPNIMFFAVFFVVVVVVVVVLLSFQTSFRNIKKTY